MRKQYLVCLGVVLCILAAIPAFAQNAVLVGTVRDSQQGTIAGAMVTLTNVDTGTLVITNQRVAYIGRTKSTSTTLPKLLHVEVYTDALAVFKEGRENPEFYLTSQPKRAVFLLNWVLAQQSGSKL